MSLAKFVLRHRLVIIIIYGFIIVLSALAIPRLKLTVDINNFFVGGEQALANHRYNEELFGENDFVGVLIEGEDVFSKSNLEFIHKVSRTIEDEIPFTHNALSIVDFPQKRKYRFTDQGQLVGSKERLDSISATRLNDVSLDGRFFSSDRKEAFITCALDIPDEIDGDGDFDFGKSIFETLSGIETPNHVKLTIVTPKVYVYRIRSHMMNDLSKILLWAGIFALVLCLIFFRDLQSFFGALLLIVSTPVIVFGIFSWLAFRLMVLLLRFLFY